VVVLVGDERVRVGLGLAAVRVARRGVASLVDGLVPSVVPFGDVTDMWEAFDGIERLAASAKTLLAARVEDAGGWKWSGARSAAEHLARLGGTTASAARRSLETSKQVLGLAAVSVALRAGVLSTVQVDAIASAAAADPSAERRLLGLAHTTSVGGLREECLRTSAVADRDRDATHGRIDAQRYVRTFTDGAGARNLQARGTAERVALIERVLEPFIDDLYVKGRAEGCRESRDAYAFDALVMLAEREQAPRENKRAPKPRYFGLLHVDVEPLVRGAIEGEETCEIAGVGPVRVARELLGESVLKLVITKGVDVVNVTHLGRGPTAAQRIALLWSSPRCANVECSSAFTQIDHREPWATTKHTVLGELDPLCPHHHKLKTNRGWALVHGTGRRAFVGPNDPRHPRNKPPPDTG
jgi:hypothetical protein